MRGSRLKVVAPPAMAVSISPSRMAVAASLTADIAETQALSKEIDGVVQRVRPDGKVALRLLGEVQIAGLTTQEIAEKLKLPMLRIAEPPDAEQLLAQPDMPSLIIDALLGTGSRPGLSPEMTTSIPSARARVRTTAIVCG